MAKFNFGGAGSFAGQGLNANPRTGAVAGAKIEKGGQHAWALGQVPRRSRGAATPKDKLASIPQDWRKAFEGLQNPRVGFRVLGEDVEAKPIDANTQEALTPRVKRDPVTNTVDLSFHNARGEECQDVLFVTEDHEDPDTGDVTKGAQYTAEGVEPLEILDHVEVTAAPETINKMYQAMTKFNQATGKQLRMLFSHNTMDDSGLNIVSQTKRIWRLI